MWTDVLSKPITKILCYKNNLPMSVTFKRPFEAFNSYEAC